MSRHLAAVADVLDDHVHVDAGLGERIEDRPRDARTIRHGHDRDLGHVPGESRLARVIARRQAEPRSNRR